MRRQLPPFSAVRAFEASARHLSFKNAADELCLTQSAISHQVKSLEEYLGVQLFYRETRGVALTEEGTRYLGGISAVLDRMAAETDRIRKRDLAGPLSVRSAPGFMRWLVPRLAGFHEAYPDIDLHLSGVLAPADFASEDIDINIRWGYVPDHALSVTPLAASTRYPVIAPALLRKGPAIEAPEDLVHYVILHEGNCRNFERWLRFVGVAAEMPLRGVRLATYDHVVQAAVEGQGIAIGYDAVVADEIAAGRLTRLFDFDYPERILYSLVTPREWAERPRIAAFSTWLLRETSSLYFSEAAAALAGQPDVSAHARP